MSQLLGRIAKLSSSVGKKQRLCFSKVRPFSAAAAAPYLLLSDTMHKGTTELLVDVNLYDPRKDESVKIPNQTLSEKLFYAIKIGSSRGWVGMKNLRDSTMHLTNIYNPCASVSSHKVISLPPLENRRSVVALSLSAPPDHEDCVVAIRSSSSLISLCRPGDSDWTHIHPYWFASEVMYSDKDRCFYLHRTLKKGEEDPTDPNPITVSDFPQLRFYHRFPLSDIPKSRQDQIVSTWKKQHLVESPSGDCFIVYWYKEYPDMKETEATKRIMKSRTFVVFRQDHEQKMAFYTEDIGDLSIFIGHNETFCVSATEYPGLKPNTVYFAGYDTGFGFYELSSNTLHQANHPLSFSASKNWLAPLQ